MAAVRHVVGMELAVVDVLVQVLGIDAARARVEDADARLGEAALHRAAPVVSGTLEAHLVGRLGVGDVELPADGVGHHVEQDRAHVIELRDRPRAERRWRRWRRRRGRADRRGSRRPCIRDCRPSSCPFHLTITPVWGAAIISVLSPGPATPWAVPHGVAGAHEPALGTQKPSGPSSRSTVGCPSGRPRRRPYCRRLTARARGVSAKKLRISSGRPAQRGSEVRRVEDPDVGPPHALGGELRISRARHARAIDACVRCCPRWAV